MANKVGILSTQFGLEDRRAVIYNAGIFSFGSYPLAVHHKTNLRFGHPYLSVSMEGEVERKRRVHLKSRAGCVNCKARRIKVRPASAGPDERSLRNHVLIRLQCQETRPSCANCDRKHLACIYRKPEKDGPLLIVKQPSSRPQWSSSSSSQFNMTDMQLFHHFLINASNMMPSERIEVWTMDLPRIAHQVRIIRHVLMLLERPLSCIVLRCTKTR